MSEIPYLNLTSGLEMINRFPDARLVRIQSSQLETYALWKVIAGLDYGFLFDAALSGVALIDCGSRRSAVSRAQWQGVPWIRYAYQRATAAEISHTPYANDFSRVYERSHACRDDALNKLRYVCKMTGKSDLAIRCLSEVSTMDGDYAALRALLIANYNMVPA